MKKFVSCTAASLYLAGSHYALAADNVHFTGTLIAISCTLPDSDKDITLDFGTVIEKSLYQYQRTKSQPFTIHLENCNPAIAGSVNVTFQGIADSELTNLLALDSVSTAKGVALGLELADGTPLAINKAAPWVPLASGNNSLNFNAYIQALPSQIAARSLTAGDFIATSTFVLSYQ